MSKSISQGQKRGTPAGGVPRLEMTIHLGHNLVMTPQVRQRIDPEEWERRVSLPPRRPDRPGKKRA